MAQNWWLFGLWWWPPTTDTHIPSWNHSVTQAHAHSLSLFDTHSLSSAATHICPTHTHTHKTHTLAHIRGRFYDDERVRTNGVEKGDRNNEKSEAWSHDFCFKIWWLDFVRCSTKQTVIVKDDSVFKVSCQDALKEKKRKERKIWASTFWSIDTIFKTSFSHSSFVLEHFALN